MLKLWDKQENLALQDGTINTPEQVYSKFPFTKVAENVVIEVVGGVTCAIDNLAILCSVYGVDDELPPADALQEIKAARTRMTEEAENSVSVEERTAAALEFLAMNSLPDVE